MDGTGELLAALVARARQPNRRSHRIHQQPNPPRVCAFHDDLIDVGWRGVLKLATKEPFGLLGGAALLGAKSQLCASPGVVITRRRDLAGGGALSRQHLAG
jgi:hypothetical protein